MQNTRQKRMEAEHSQNNSFVKKQQSELARLSGKAPKVPESMFGMSASMVNNGEHAQELCRKLTAGLDKVAFPVK